MSEQNQFEDRAVATVMHIMRNAGMDYPDMQADAAALVIDIAKYTMWEMSRNQRTKQHASPYDASVNRGS